jgi:hypothetical protein
MSKIDSTATFAWSPDRTPGGCASAFAVSRDEPGEAWTRDGERGERIPHDPSFAGLYTTREAAVARAYELWRCSFSPKIHKGTELIPTVTDGDLEDWDRDGVAYS